MAPIEVRAMNHPQRILGLCVKQSRAGSAYRKPRISFVLSMDFVCRITMTLNHNLAGSLS